MTHNIGIDIEKLISELPPGLDRAMLRILSYRQGREAAINRNDLLDGLANLGFAVHERAARACINKLRKEGHLICSTGGHKSGYWIAKDWAELNEYINRELHARAMDLLEQEKALKDQAERQWGMYSRQEKLW